MNRYSLKKLHRTLLLFPIISATCALGAEIPATSILKQSGVTGGLIVHYGCTDAAQTTAFRLNDRYMVHGLTLNEDRVSTIRKQLLDRGVYGNVTVDAFNGHLPYLDNSVNLYVAADSTGVKSDDLMRVLTPGGVAMQLQNGQWTKTVKPLNPNTDDWSHYMNDSSGNAVAHDSVISPPRNLKWTSGPKWSRSHSQMGSMTCLVSAGGKVFYIVDEGSIAYSTTAPKWSLYARDAYNGTKLWQVPIDRWHTHMWRLKSGPAQIPRRLVADDKRVYATLDIDGPVSALDAITGRTIYTSQPTAGTEEIIENNGVLFLLVNPARATGKHNEPIRQDYGKHDKNSPYGEEPKMIMAVKADSGKVLWKTATPVLPLTLSADSTKVCFHNGESIVALDRNTGKKQWASPPVVRRKPVPAYFAPTLIIYEDVVLFAGGESADKDAADTMHSFDGNSGEKLWSADHPRSGYNSPEDLFVIDGLVWCGDTGGGNSNCEFFGRDPRTGEVKKHFPPSDRTNYHHRCHRGKATDNYIITSIRGMEFIDFRKETWELNNWLRGGCFYGIMPANGMTYTPPHPCTCYLQSKLTGFNAVYGDNGKTAVPEITTRLKKGPAFGKIGNQKSAIGNASWPTHRADNLRSGIAKTTVPAKVSNAWKTEIGGKLTSPVSADGRVFVAQVNQHTLHALDAASGKKLWSYTTGGRIDSPPTIFNGGVFFGSADGHVYCLRATDGALAWSFLATREDRKLMNYDQLEAVHPLNGSVLIRDGIIYCVAGRSMFLDGGLTMYKLDPTSGSMLLEKPLTEIDPTTGDNLQKKMLEQHMPIALPDILSCDDNYLYMRAQHFNFDCDRPEIEVIPKKKLDVLAAEQGEKSHLFSPPGFLDDAGFHRNYFMYGQLFFGGHQGDWVAEEYSPAGKLIVLDKDKVYGSAVSGNHTSHPGEGAYLFAMDKTPKLPNTKNRREGQPKNQRKSKKSDKGDPEHIQLPREWKQDVNIEVTGLVKAGDIVFAAGFDADGRSRLYATDANSGGIKSQLEIPAAPVHDGMAAADEKLIISGKDGAVYCFK